MDLNELRQQVYATTMQLCEAGLIRLSAGNISARDAEGRVAITPSGLAYTKMRPEDIVIVDLDGKLVEGALKPSSETPMHTAIYRALPKVGAVVHTHSIYAIALATCGLELPVISLEVVAIGGPVPVAPYACPGSAEAGDIAGGIFSARPELKALLLRNHGLVTIGGDLDAAYQNAYKCETGAQIFHLGLQTGRTSVALTAEQLEEIFRVYRKR
jgi:ribulose-5-phosphate 4-epimerase/fuculose-1-phosphate aldolase